MVQLKCCEVSLQRKTNSHEQNLRIHRSLRIIRVESPDLNHLLVGVNCNSRAQQLVQGTTLIFYSYLESDIPGSVIWELPIHVLVFMKVGEVASPREMENRAFSERRTSGAQHC